MDRYLVWLLGALIIVIGSIAFYAIAENVANRSAVVHFDQQLAQFVRANVARPTLDVVLLFTRLGSEVPTVGAVLLIILFLYRRRWRDVTLVIVNMGGAALIVAGIKLLIARERPVFDDPIQIINSFSFPSGHAFFAVTFYGMIAYYWIQRYPIWWARVIVYAVVGVLALLIGFTRIYIGVHFLSDVIAGYFGGLVWLTLSLTGVAYLYRRRIASLPQPGSGLEGM